MVNRENSKDLSTGVSIGDMVKLTKEARKFRVAEMASWKGFVIGMVRFPMEKSKETILRAKVDWGKRRDQKPPFLWLELPEDLDMA